MFVNLAYALYLTVITAVVMAPVEVNSGFSFLTRILLVIGAFWRLASPPAFIRSMEGSGSTGEMLRTAMSVATFGKLKRWPKK